MFPLTVISRRQTVILLNYRYLIFLKLFSEIVEVGIYEINRVICPNNFWYDLPSYNNIIIHFSTTQFHCTNPD